MSFKDYLKVVSDENKKQEFECEIRKKKKEQDIKEICSMIDEVISVLGFFQYKGYICNGYKKWKF